MSQPYRFCHNCGASLSPGQDYCFRLVDSLASVINAAPAKTRSIKRGCSSDSPKPTTTNSTGPNLSRSVKIFGGGASGSSTCVSNISWYNLKGIATVEYSVLLPKRRPKNMLFVTHPDRPNHKWVGLHHERTPLHTSSVEQWVV
jgi:hypothetical protein